MSIGNLLWRDLRLIRKATVRSLVLSIVIAIVGFRCKDAVLEWWLNLQPGSFSPVYNFLASDQWISWILFLGGIYFCDFVSKRLLASRNIHFIYIAIGFCWITYSFSWAGSWVPIKFGSFEFSFEVLSVIFGASIALPDLVKCIDRIVIFFKRCFLTNRKDEDEDGKKVLPMRSVNYIDDGRRKAASIFTKLILSVDLKNEPIAAGIVGEWGSGKTSFLKMMKREVEQSGNIFIDFYPWQSTGVSNLIEDFFKSLSMTLHGRSRRLGKALEDYSNKLIELDIDHRINAVMKIVRMITGSYLTINSLRNKIEKDIADLNQSIVVFIDDIDRLDSDELFETFRLIRNTAHFRNIAYVVAYDRDYVVKMLQRKGIENASRYLDKIFRLNFQLPFFERSAYVDVIISQLKRIYEEESEDFKFLFNLVLIGSHNRNVPLLNVIIKNYRETVALASHLISHYEMLKANMVNFKDNICAEDWFYLQLIYFFYPSLYSVLENNNESVLVKRTENDETIFVPSLGLKEKINSLCPDIPTDDTRLDILLNRLFDNKKRKRGANSLVFERNFYNYFAYRLLNTELDEREFLEMLAGRRKQLYYFSSWGNRKPSISPSVTSRFVRQNIRLLNEIEVANYVKAILNWWMIYPSVELSKKLESLNNLSDSKVFPAVTKAYYKTIKRLAMTAHGKWSLLCQPVQIQAPDPKGRDNEDELMSSPHCLTKNQVVEIFNIIVERAFKTGDISRVDDLTNVDTPLYKILNSSNVEFQNDRFYLIENYTISEIMKRWRKRLMRNPELRGRRLDLLVHMYSYKGDYQLLDDRKKTEVRDKFVSRIMRMFGAFENLFEIINAFYDASPEDKQDAIMRIEQILPIKNHGYL